MKSTPSRNARPARKPGSENPQRYFNPSTPASLSRLRSARKRLKPLSMVSPAFRKASKSSRRSSASCLIISAKFSSRAVPMSGIMPKRSRLDQIFVDGLTRVPEGFEIQPKIKRIVLDHQRKVFEQGGPYEWHYAEALAFGSDLCRWSHPRSGRLRNPAEDQAHRA